mmetsp:Transcript_16975/g.49168  ORF Transcript_16975/g.49168 Transcript_16975/m.49168 type:complete len:276 (+) Transcript_16975:1647-2474(+)
MASALRMMQTAMAASNTGCSTKTKTQRRGPVTGRSTRSGTRSESIMWFISTHSRCSLVSSAVPVSCSLMRLKLSMTTPTMRLKTKKEPTTIHAMKKSACHGDASRDGARSRASVRAPMAVYITVGHISRVASSSSSRAAAPRWSKWPKWGLRHTRGSTCGGSAPGSNHVPVQSSRAVTAGSEQAASLPAKSCTPRMPKMTTKSTATAITFTTPGTARSRADTTVRIPADREMIRSGRSARRARRLRTPRSCPCASTVARLTATTMASSTFQPLRR